jgi:hypothetical protein
MESVGRYGGKYDWVVELPLLTALAVSVLAERGNPNSRSSLPREIKAGQTPYWYLNLSPDIKSYVASVQTHATTGCSVTPTPSL